MDKYVGRLKECCGYFLGSCTSLALMHSLVPHEAVMRKARNKGKEQTRADNLEIAVFNSSNPYHFWLHHTVWIVQSNGPSLRKHNHTYAPHYKQSGPEKTEHIDSEEYHVRKNGLQVQVRFAMQCASLREVLGGLRTHAFCAL